MRGTRTLRAALALLTLLAVPALLAPATAGAAAKPKDPVVAIITASTAIPAGTRTQLRGQWAASESMVNRLTRAHSTTRAKELAAARAVLTSMAKAKTLSAANIQGAMLDVHASTVQFGTTSRRFPSREERVEDIPGETAVFTYYPGTGLHLNPLFTWSKVAHDVADGDVDAAVVLLRRMETISVQRKGYLTWEYYFPWQGGAAGWTSAMAQATAVQSMARVHLATQDPHWLDLAHQAMPGFTIDARNGGLSTTVPGGRWFYLYPFNYGQRILNGDLQSLLGLAEFAKTENDPAVAALVQQGVAGALPMLAAFDTGAWSRYQLGQEADLGYHDLMITQLHRLRKDSTFPAALIAPDAEAAFGTLEDHYTLYRITPPSITVPAQALPTLYPQSQDGAFDVMHLQFSTDKRATLNLTVRGADGGIVASLGKVTQGRGTGTIDWDARNNSHTVVPPGNYSLTWSATDVAGNTSTGAFAGPIVVARDTTAPQLLSTTVTSLGPKKTRIVLKVSDVESAYVTARFGSGSAAPHAKGKGTVVLVVPQPAATVRAGSVTLVDTSGNTTTVQVAVGSSPAPAPSERAALDAARAGARRVVAAARFGGAAQRRPATAATRARARAAAADDAASTDPMLLPAP